MQSFNLFTNWLNETVAIPLETYIWKPVGDTLFPDANATKIPATPTQDPEASAPIIWLLGKTGAGKSSIVQTLTGEGRVQVGSGFRPCTKTASIFNFPVEAPLLRFLDTRGLEESGYDPAEDLALCAKHASCIIAVAKVTDPNQSTVIAAVRTARATHPDWPVLVALTGLHETYQANSDHIQPYPFGPDGRPSEREGAVPQRLRALLEFQHRQFADLPGSAPVRFVPIDFTQPGDGFSDLGYGASALEGAIVELAPGALSARLRELADGGNNEINSAVFAAILSWSFIAGAGGLIPVPFVDAGVITVAIAGLLRALARFYKIELTAQVFAAFGSSLGSGVLISWLARYAGREALKLIPFVGTPAGMALSSAAAFAFVFAIGHAASTYFGYLKRGEAVPEDAIKDAFQRAIEEGFKRAKRGASEPQSDVEKPQ